MGLKKTLGRRGGAWKPLADLGWKTTRGGKNDDGDFAALSQFLHVQQLALQGFDVGRGQGFLRKKCRGKTKRAEREKCFCATRGLPPQSTF